MGLFKTSKKNRITYIYCSATGEKIEIISEYRGKNDWLGIFLDDCCEVDASYIQKSGELYQEYREYCARIGEYTRSTTDFYTAIENAGFKRRKTRAGSMISGIRLKSGFLEA